MKDDLFYSRTFAAINSDLDFMKRLRVSRLFTWLQDVAGLHVEEMGVGLDYLHVRRGIAWIIMRMRVEISRLPSLYEEVSVETWPLRPRGVFHRDFRIVDKDGACIVRAASVWILMDMESRTLIKDSQAGFRFDNYREERAIDRKLVQLRAPDGLSPVYERALKYSDADYNAHTNNTRYLDYAMDCMDMDFLRTYRPGAVEVDFINESKPGDKITLFESPMTDIESEPVIYIEGKNSDTGMTIFKTRMEYIKDDRRQTDGADAPPVILVK